ncbi:MAG: F0F1 ATP synthase subunit epsilon [Candidatus Accumulibacter sp.]|jgi:F-type H+-transporting ATPase subunit epsilon|nr:F0F1 ATP synthase subunit epsilon [Accumulibacter sp.]
MALKVHVDVVSAEEEIFSGEAEFAVFPGESGELGILPRHAPLLTRVRPGAVRLKIPDRDAFELVYISGGILEVQPTLITLLADTAIRAKDLDEAEAIKAKQKAAEVLRNRSADVSYASAEAELAQTITQMQLHTLKKGRKPRH